MLDTQVRPRAVDGLLGRDLGDEFLFIDEDGRQVHVLNGTAREIYLLCDGSRSVGQVGQELTERYEVDPETASRDAAEIIERLIGLGLLLS